MRCAVYDGSPGAFFSPCRLLYMCEYVHECVCMFLTLNGSYIWPLFSPPGMLSVHCPGFLFTESGRHVAELQYLTDKIYK